MSYFFFGDVGPPKNNEVHIGKTAIVMPLGKILLIKKGSDCCGVKFLKFWNGKTELDKYAIYELFSKKDKLGDFTIGNIEKKTKELSFPKPRGIGRLAFSFGNKEIQCGKLKLLWGGEGAVLFSGEGKKQKDYGIELAPTDFEDIHKVDINSKKITWYRYDSNRKRKNIPLSLLPGGSRVAPAGGTGNWLPVL